MTERDESPDLDALAEPDAQIRHYRQRAETAEFLYAQEREFSIDAAKHTTELRNALHDLCDAFKQVYEAAYAPAPAGENGVYHHARKLLGESQ